MPLLSTEVYDAFRELGVPDATARRAAEALAMPNADLMALRTNVTVLKTDVTVLKDDVAALKGDVAVLKTDVAVLKGDVVHIQHRLTTLTWSIGLGFSLVMAVLLLELNWLWQILQRLTQAP